MNRIAVFIAAGAVGLMLSSAAAAQGYLGLAGGPTDLNADCAGTLTCDKSGTGYKLYGGYRFTRNLAGELGYYSFGKAHFAGQVGASPAALDIKPTGFGLGMAYFGGFSNDWTGVVRLGVARVKADVTGTLGSGIGFATETSTSAYYGFGLGYLMTPNLSFEGALDFSKAKFGGESGSVRLLSIGVSYAF